MITRSDYDFTKAVPKSFKPSEENYSTLWKICKPESASYMKTIGLTLLHASLFMYLPQVYTDINYLMSLTREIGDAALFMQYGIIVSKWAAIFGSLSFLTYNRRFHFLDISNKIGNRLRAVVYQKTLNRALNE